MQKQVSIIVPAYNSEAYLVQCLDSLVEQTLPDIEILVVNDGSTDNTGEIADQYARNYPNRIITLHKPNGGLSDARNYGIERATGRYIGFVDSDDWVEINMFAEMLRLAVEQRADICVCAMVQVDAETGTTVPIRLRELDNFGYSVGQRPHLLFSAHSYACNKLFRRELFTDTGYRFPDGQWFEDSAIVYTVMTGANKIVHTTEALYCYRKGHAGTITGSVDPRMFDAFKSCDAIIQGFEDHGIYSGEAVRAVERVARRHIFARFAPLFDASDRRFAWSYMSQSFSYMDSRFPGWRDRYYATLRSAGLKGLSKRYRSVAWLYLHAPRSFREAPIDILRSMVRTLRYARSAVLKPLRRRTFARDGFQVFRDLNQTLGAAGVTYFADFGTMLGFIREGGFLAHDKDIDVGVFVSPTDRHLVREAIESGGYRLWRRWVLDGRVVEESYRKLDSAGYPLLKFDINYYESDENGAWTWLFYRAPGVSYPPGERSAVRMHYGPISGTRELVVQGETVPVPVEAERLLEEKYGPNWRTPDKKWIYWQSPAAELLTTRGYFVQYN